MKELRIEFDENGVEISRETVDVPDTRPTQVCKDTDGRILTPTRIYEAQSSGHITHRCVGEAEPKLRVSCPKAEYWNETCAEHVLTEVSDGMSPEQLAAAEREAFIAIFGMVEHMKAHGCPVHDPATAEPATLDGLLQGLTPQRMAQLFAEVNSAPPAG